MEVYVIYMRSDVFDDHWTATDLTLDEELAKRAVNRWESKGFVAFFEKVTVDKGLTILLC